MSAKRFSLALQCALAVGAAALVAPILHGRVTAWPQATGMPLGQATTSPAGGRRVQPADLVYQGAFRLPLPDWGTATFAYGGTALAFHPARHSLFIVGHDWHQQVAEISIPAIRQASSVNELATATLLQPLTEITEGHMPKVGPSTVKVGGLLPYDGRLFVTAYLYYDGAGSQTVSHFTSGLDLTVQGDVRGPHRVGALGAGFVSGYFALVPEEWQAALGGPVLNGQCCLAVVGRTSFGPAVSSIDPTHVGVKDPVPATPLVYYTAAHPTLGTWEGTNPYFNGSTEVRGVVFAEGTESVLFFGRHGLGSFCYGTGEDCHDPTDNSKGTHGYPYAYYVWAYDAADLAAVKSRRRQPWSVKPYAVWKLDLPFTPPGIRLGGAAYDPATGRIFVSQAFGDGTKPLIHVLTIKTARASG